MIPAPSVHVHRLVCAAVLVLVAMWALAPLPPAPVISRPPSAETARQPAPEVTPLDLSIFRAPLWVAPPAPAAAPSPPAPLRLQLIAITAGGESGGVERMAALVYDPDQDTLLTLHEGDTLAGGTRRRVERIVPDRVYIRDVIGGPSTSAGPEHALSLRADQAGAVP